jgi:hypothetical protein
MNFMEASMKRTTALWICLLFSFLVAIPLTAQTVTGTIRGTITDQSGAIVQGAKVTAINIATGVQTPAVANSAGEYAIRFLQIGQYKITVEAAGFQKADYGPFALEIDQVAKVDIPLKIGASSTTIEVTEAAQPILQTENPTNGETFTENTINAMPLNGRDFSQLTVFTPGAVSTGYGTYGAVSGSASNSSERSTNASNEANVNGSRQQSNNFLLDGQEINENINNTIGYSPSPDALEEMRVIASNANAEFGNVNGGEVVMVTRSGTNHFHGSAFGFLSNDNLNANTWVNDQSGIAKPAYTQSTFGGTIGGPIFRDKLFFFADYEGFRYHSSGQAAFSLVPPAFLQGNLSAVLNVLGIQLYDTQNLNAAGQPAPYSNNQIPVNNPVAQFLAAHSSAYPSPNNPTADPLGIYHNYLGPKNVFSRNDQGDIKIDWHLRDRDTISSRYSQGYAQDATISDPVPVQFPSGSNYPDHLGTITWTHTLSPAIVNYARASYARIQFNSGITIDPSGIFGSNGNSLVGIPSNPQQAAGFSQQSFFGIGGTTSNQNGYPDGFGANPTPEVFVDNVFEYADNLTWQRGRHLLKFGAEFTRYQQNSFYPGNDGELGDFTYNGQYSALPSSKSFYPFADFLLDRVYDVQIGAVTGLTGQRQWRDGVFAQDDWKITDKLTLNLGMRWEFDQPIYEVNNKMANVNMQTGQIIYAGQNGNSRALYDPYYGGFQPRFGFNYQINPKLVVRGGYGITSYLEGMGANLRLTQNPPFHTDFEQQGQNPTGSGNTITSKGIYYQTANGFPTTAVPTTTFYVWPKDLMPSSTQEATLTTEYALTPSSTFQVGYVLILGHHLTQPYWGNQLTSPGATAPYANIVGQNGVVKISQTEGASNYNGLQAVYRQHLTQGLELTANYTYAKSLTDNFGYYGVTNTNSGQYYQQDAYDPAAEWGPSGFDIRHALSVTGVYDLPFGRGKRFGSSWNRFIDEGLGGWKLAGSNVTYTSFPVTAGSPAHYSSSVFGFTGAARPNQLRPLEVHNRSINAYWGTDVQSGGSGFACPPDTDNGTCVFQQQSNSGFGALRPFALRGPGFEQIDMAVSKSFTVWREQHLDFRGDFFNAFNITSYQSPDSGVADSNFGQITNTNSTERHIQLSLKYVF